MSQPTLPDVSLDEDDYGGRAKRKTERAGIEMPSKWEETGIYPGARKLIEWAVGDELISAAPRGSYEVYDAYGQYAPQVEYEQLRRSGGLPYLSGEYGR